MILHFCSEDLFDGADFGLEVYPKMVYSPHRYIPEFCQILPQRFCHPNCHFAVPLWRLEILWELGTRLFQSGTLTTRAAAIRICRQLQSISRTVTSMGDINIVTTGRVTVSYSLTTIILIDSFMSSPASQEESSKRKRSSSSTVKPPKRQHFSDLFDDDDDKHKTQDKLVMAKLIKAGFSLISKDPLPSVYVRSAVGVVLETAELQDPTVPLSSKSSVIGSVLDEDAEFWQALVENCLRTQSFKDIRNHRTLLAYTICNRKIWSLWIPAAFRTDTKATSRQIICMLYIIHFCMTYSILLSY